MYIGFWKHCSLKNEGQADRRGFPSPIRPLRVCHEQVRADRRARRRANCWQLRGIRRYPLDIRPAQNLRVLVDEATKDASSSVAVNLQNFPLAVGHIQVWLNCFQL